MKSSRLVESAVSSLFGMTRSGGAWAAVKATKVPDVVRGDPRELHFWDWAIPED
jgi:hypothetical protein